MRKLIFVIVLGASYWFWSGGKLPFTSPAGAFDDSGAPLVWVFTVSKCAPCQMTIKELKQRKVPFEEKLVDPNAVDDENFSLWKKMGRGNFPFIVAGDKKVIGSSPARLAVILGENFGDKYLTRTEKRYYKKHFYPDSSPKIVMYSASWCQYCKKLRNEFRAEGIDFLEIDVEKSGEKEMMSRVMEIPGYPATWVGYKRILDGGSLKAIKAAL